MFSSIINKSKASKWFKGCGDDSFDWRQSIRNLEDSLTAFVFDILITMRGTTIASLLSGASGSCANCIDWLGNDRFQVKYWPSYDSGESYVEPDIVILDSKQKQCIIVEAKWRDKQKYEQIVGQVDAVSRRYPDYKVTMLLLGGDNVKRVWEQVRNDLDPKVKTISISWLKLQLSIKSAINKNDLPSEKRALKQMQRGLKWYGIRLFEGFLVPGKGIQFEKPQFFNDFPIEEKIKELQEFPWFSDMKKLQLNVSSISNWRLV